MHLQFQLFRRLRQEEFEPNLSNLVRFCHQKRQKRKINQKASLSAGVQCQFSSCHPRHTGVPPSSSPCFSRTTLAPEQPYPKGPSQGSTGEGYGPGPKFQPSDFTKLTQTTHCLVQKVELDSKTTEKSEGQVRGSPQRPKLLFSPVLPFFLGAFNSRPPNPT